MNYKDIIESRYNRNSWMELLHDIFRSGVDFLSAPINVESDNHLAESSLLLGSITLKDDNRIAVYEIKLTDNVDIVSNRVGIRNLMAKHWKMMGCAGAFMFCYRDNESVLRFSYVSSISKFNDEGTLETDETDTKRFTYLLGEGHRSRTAITQFEVLKKSGLTLADITKAFSVEALSKQFFNDYKRIYEDIILFATGKKMVKRGNQWVEEQEQEPDQLIKDSFRSFDDWEKAVRDYVKKLMGRIVFLQFLQKKGWLGVKKDDVWGSGDKEFLMHLYDRSSMKDNFIDGVLEVLFNDINTKRPDDKANDILGKDIKIPYLNGGLFDNDQADKCRFVLPKEHLDNMFSFFSSYNFTIDENDPNDAEVGVDPEMLGHIFENLLEDNKDKGAFYTPKEIVKYMCTESLINYLQNDIDEDCKESVRQFVLTHERESLPYEMRAEIDEKLKNVKICDPAIGSGAFPMGLLKELFECRHAIEGMQGVEPADIKKQIIQNNIYGVDIEKGAVDIARLRFWLSIVVDEKSPHALPNMDFKIVQGNSLIPTFRGKYINLNDNERHLNSVKISTAKNKLSELQKAYFNAEGDFKKELLVQIRYQILEIVKLQMDYEYTVEIQNCKQRPDMFNPDNSDYGIVDEEKKDIVNACILAQRRLMSPSTPLSVKIEMDLPFFDWNIIFPEIFKQDGGFDIVIGNPPYIQLQANNGLLGKLYEPRGFKTFAGTGDIYCLFFEEGYNLLKEKGHLCYITSNKWMRAGYGEKTRGFLSKFVNPKLLVDFAGVKIFENATVDTNILLYSKSENQYNTTCVVANKNNENCLNKLSEFVQQQSVICHFKSSDSWVILSPIEQSIKRKIESIGTPLKDWDIQINYGIKTGFNEAFIISTEKRNEILDNCTSEEERTKTVELIRPILRGRDIKRYGYNWANLWLIATFPSRHYDIDDYPAVKNYLLSYGKERLEQTGKKYIIDGEEIKARKKTNNKWFETQDSISYWDDFFKPKIMFQEIVHESQFILDFDKHFFCNDTGRIIIGEHPYHLLGMLNSELFFFAVKHFYGGGRLGEYGIRMKHTFFEKFPCLPYEYKIEHIAMNLQQSYNNTLNQALNDYIMTLYQLTEEEKMYVKNRL